MNTLISPIFSWLIIAIITGLAILATTHYAVFKDIFNWLLVIVFIVFVALFSFLSGYLYGFSDLKEFIVSGYQAIEIPLPRYSEVIYLYLAIGALLLGLYIYFLYIYLLDYLGKKIELAKKNSTKIWPEE